MNFFFIFYLFILFVNNIKKQFRLLLFIKKKNVGLFSIQNFKIRNKTSLLFLIHSIRINKKFVYSIFNLIHMSNFKLNS
jgi:hypothetical protein